jgi:hypothetical protein
MTEAFTLDDAARRDLERAVQDLVRQIGPGFPNLSDSAEVSMFLIDAVRNRSLAPEVRVFALILEGLANQVANPRTVRRKDLLKTPGGGYSVVESLENPLG